MKSRTAGHDALLAGGVYGVDGFVGGGWCGGRYVFIFASSAALLASVAFISRASIFAFIRSCFGSFGFVAPCSRFASICALDVIVDSFKVGLSLRLALGLVPFLRLEMLLGPSLPVIISFFLCFLKGGSFLLPAGDIRR